MANWGSSYPNGRIDYTPYSLYADAWNSRGGSRSSNMLLTSAQNFEICDYAGNWIATMHDGELISSDPSIFAFQPVDMDLGDDLLVYLPADTYQIVNTAPDEELSLSMYNWDLGQELRTQSDVVVLSVRDEEDCNMVYLSTEEGDAYDVTLIADPEISGYDELTFTGTGDGSVVQIGMLGGELVLANCPDIIINGASRQRSLADCQVRLEYLQVKGDGTEKRPGVTIIDGQRPLEQDVDYTLGYVSNVNVGFATVAIYGKGLYTGELFLSFEILSTEPCLDGHVWGEPELVIAPTLAKDGTVRRYCEHCGRCREESLAAYSFEQTAFADGVLSISLQNNMVTALNGICFLTAYDGQGSMLASEQLEVYIEPNEGSAFSLALPPDSVCQRAFILDRDTFSPLGPVWDNAD